jgi:hypothetical protein
MFQRLEVLRAGNSEVIALGKSSRQLSKEALRIRRVIYRQWSDIDFNRRNTMPVPPSPRVAVN